MKKTYVIISIIIILIICFILSYSNNNKNKLKDIGYNNIEIKEILKLSDKEINKILKYDYNENYIYVIKSDTYDSNKLDLYLKYIAKYKNISYLKIFNLLNNKNINIEKIDKYINLLNNYNNIKGIINYINNYENLNIQLNDITLELLDEKYFIIDYLNRYLSFYEKNSNLDFSEIVTRVNCNLDLNFYIDSTKANVTKGMYTLVNKYNYLENNFIPEDLETVSYNYAINNTQLNKTALQNFIMMADEASKNNLTLKITTAYRDYDFQKILYNNYVSLDGKEKADTYSARPGYSEHQFGYSVDLTNKNYSSFSEFEFTKEYEWLKENAHKYGFILRYPKNKEYLTGYQFESWHYRYVGIDIATYIYENNITYDEYYAYFLR